MLLLYRSSNSISNRKASRSGDSRIDSATHLRRFVPRTTLRTRELSLGGIGGLQTPISFLGPQNQTQNCLGPNQKRTMGSISYAEETQQYLLTFVCISSDCDPPIRMESPQAHPGFIRRTRTSLIRTTGARHGKSLDRGAPSRVPPVRITLAGTPP